MTFADTTTVRRRPSRWTALTVLCLSMMMIILDGTVVSVALPQLQSGLGFTAESLVWTVNAYLLPLGGLLLLAGRLGDLVGRRRTLLTGLVLFVVASLLCGLAVNAPMLVAARFLQGAAAALASAVVLGMIVRLFPDPAERARAMGAYAFVGAAGASTGLLLGGVLAAALSWRWIFLVNLPIGVAAVALTLWAVEPDRPAARVGRPDVLGGVLVTAGLVLAVLAIVDTSAWPQRVLWAGLALVLLAGFVVRQRRAAHPLVRLGVFRSRAVTVGNLVQLLIVAGMLGFQFIAALHLQQALGYGPATTGLAIVPVAAVIAIVSLGVAGRLVGRYGAWPVLLAGEALLIAGLLLLARPDGPALGYALGMLPALVVLGVGAGLVLPAVTTVIMSDAGEADAGLASGLAGTSQQIGGALGTAVLAVVAASRADALLAGGTAATDALAGGFRVAFLVSAASVALAAVVTVVLLRPSRS